MEHLPGALDGAGVGMDGHFRLMAGIAILVMFAMYAVLLWAVRRTRENREGPREAPPSEPPQKKRPKAA